MEKSNVATTSLTGSVEGDQALIDGLERRRFAALHGNNRCDGKYGDYLAMYLGEETWQVRQTNATWYAQSGFNILQHAVDQQVSAEMDAGLIPEIEPMESEDLLKARLMESIVLPHWESPGFIQARAGVSKQRIMAGTASPMVAWNKNIDDITLYVQDPRAIYCTSKAQTEAEVTEYFREAWMDVGEIARKYPDAPPVEPNENDDRGYFRTEDDRKPRRATVYYCDIRYDEDIRDDVLEAGGSSYGKFDVGDWKRVAYCDGAVLEIRKMARSRPPQIIVPNYIISTSMFGMSDFRNVWRLQREATRILDAMMTGFYLTGFPPLVVSGLVTTEVGKLMARPGWAMPLGSKVSDVGKAIAYLNPPPMSAQGFELLKLCIDMIYRIMGTPDVTQGIRPPAITTGRAIEKLQAAAGMLPQQKVYNAYLGNLKILRDQIDLISRHYSDNQVLRLTGELGRETMAGIQQQGLIKQGMAEVMRQRDGTGRNFAAMVKVNFRRMFKDAVDFDLRLKLGHPLIQNRQEKEQKALMWMKLGAMDPSVAMKYAGFDDATIVENEKAMKAKEEAEAARKAEVLKAKNGSQEGGEERTNPFAGRNLAKEAFEQAMGRG